MENVTFEEHKCLILPAEVQSSVNFYSKSTQLTFTILSTICGFIFPFVTCSNFIFLRTVIKNPSLHSPPNVLLCSLATADLLTGLLSIPLFIGWMSSYELNKSCTYITIVLVFSFILFGSSFLTFLIISLERYIALFYPLRYYSLVTVSRTIKVLLVFWSYTFINCLMAASIFHFKGLLWTATTNLSLGSIIISISYTKIIILVKKHQRQIQAQLQAQHLPHASNSLRQRKTAVTMGFVGGVMFGCYIPLCCAYSVIILKGLNERTVKALLICFVVGLSATLWNPTIYCWRNREIRTAVISQAQEIKALFCGAQL